MTGGTYSYRRSLELKVKYFKEFYCTKSIHSVYRINYRIVPVSSFNKYLHDGTSGTE
jgi:hypothetical protein